MIRWSDGIFPIVLINKEKGSEHNAGAGKKHENESNKH